jgi:hypothetical protein
MDDRPTIQKYVNNFRRYISRFLKPNIGLESRIHPSTQSGAVLEFSLGEDVQNSDYYLPSSESVNASLATVGQRALSGDLSAVQFSGTSAVLEPGRIILIKGEDDPTQWSDNAASKDVQKVITSSTKATAEE